MNTLNFQKTLFYTTILLMFGVSSCKKNTPTCSKQYSYYSESAKRCICPASFIEKDDKCVCPEGYVVLANECVRASYAKLFDSWNARENCSHNDSFFYKVTIKEPENDPIHIILNNIFEVDQDILCWLEGNGCEFVGEPKINGFLVEGKMTWDSDITKLNLEYTIKSTVEESCTAELTK